MFRAWPWWLSLLLIAVSLGWFWLLSLDLSFARAEPDSRPVGNEIKR